MKNKSLILFMLLYSSALFAQQDQQKSRVIVASEFHITKPIREIFAEHPVDETKILEERESKDKEQRKPQKFLMTAEKNGYAYGNDSNSIQKKMGIIQGEPTRMNIPGQNSGSNPHDPSGAVGANHFVQMINATTFKIYNKYSGSAILTGTLGDLWSPATGNNGDPIVMYDKAADRWFMAQFGETTDKKIYIAVSVSGDPTGSYYTYTYTSPLFPDYLKFSVWADGYYMTSNQSPQKVFSFNRAEILAGNPSARSVVVNYSPPNGGGFFVPLSGDAADGSLPTYGTPCPLFSYSDNGWGSPFTDAMNIYQMSVNWVPTTPTASITLAASLPLAAFDASYDPNWLDVSQPGTTQKLDGLGGICMYRAQWKSWDGYNTVVLNWGVKINPSLRGIKWVELRQNQSTGIWSVYQEGIYAPDGTTRWCGSICMDDNGSIGMSYIGSSSTLYPGIYYVGRRRCDPLGIFTIGEGTVISGSVSKTNNKRVGDYAQTTLDMDGVTFWSTSEYMGGSSGTNAARTRIFSYQIPSNISSTTMCGNFPSGGSLSTMNSISITPNGCPSTTFSAGTNDVFKSANIIVNPGTTLTATVGANLLITADYCNY